MQTEAEQQNDELLSVDFSNYPTLAEGWEAKADKKPYSGGVTSSKSLKLNKSGYYLQTPSFNLESDATLTFIQRLFNTSKCRICFKSSSIRKWSLDRYSYINNI